MKYFYIETYDKSYDYDYHVTAENPEEAKDKLAKYWYDQDIEPKTIHAIHGPKSQKDVICVKEPSF